jgi:hypothetical protein
MASTSSLVEVGSALSADAAIAFTVLFAVAGAVTAVMGLYALKGGRKANALRLLAMSATASIGTWFMYGKYQELLVKANGVATGPIYENLALCILLCMPLALVFGLIFHRPSNAPKS